MLFVKCTDNSVTDYSVSFEMVAEDLLMITLIAKNFKTEIPSYWRLTNNVGIPPLEVGINCQNGVVYSITFFVEKTLRINDTENDILAFEGNLILDTSIFTKENDYYDVDLSYDTYFLNNKLLCCFGALDEIEKSYKIGRINFFVNYNNQFVGLSICDLTADEKIMIGQLEKACNNF